MLGIFFIAISAFNAYAIIKISILISIGGIFMIYGIIKDEMGCLFVGVFSHSIFSAYIGDLFDSKWLIQNQLAWIF